MVDFDAVHPKIKVMPKMMSSYANAVVDAVWGTKVLANKALAFDVVKSGETISIRMPRSQTEILKSKRSLSPSYTTLPTIFVK